MPLPSVKNRSKRPVMSFSMSSGGIPEKNVATTTTGMLMPGNRSTGMRTRLLTPTTTTIRQATMMKYGYRRENLDMTHEPIHQIREWRRQVLVAIRLEQPPQSFD